MDVLREISETELNFITSKLSLKLPYTIKDLHYIQSAERCRKLSETIENLYCRLLPKFFVPRTRVEENCTIFGITDHADQNVWLFTFQESLDELRECLQKTKLINWNKRVLFVTIHREHVNSIFELVSDENKFLVVDYPASYFHFPIEDALKLNIK